MKIVTALIGVALLAIGVAGLVPSLVENGMLFGVMPTNPTYSIAFIAVGAVGILIGLSHRRDAVPPGPRGPDMRPWV
jgi:hypothetical protein